MHRINFTGGTTNPSGDDSMNMVETPEESPERQPNTEREIGGRFLHMAQDREAMTRSVRNLQLERNLSDVAGAPKVVDIDLE